MKVNLFFVNYLKLLIFFYSFNLIILKKKNYKLKILTSSFYCNNIIKTYIEYKLYL